MNKMVDILKTARELISDPEDWIKGSAAVDENWMSVNAHDERACKFCAYGAVSKAHKMYGKSHEESLLSIELDATARAMGFDGYINLNDASFMTHKDVMKMFDDTIKRLEL